jgi:16S rRNA (cytidine1402-2'-O)-methyltransferase
LRALAELWPEREVAVARELTKLHEECRTGTAAALADHYAAHPPKGEIVLLVGPPAAAEAPVLDTDALLRAALAEAGPGKAAGVVAKATGIDRAVLYARALELKGE